MGRIQPQFAVFTRTLTRTGDLSFPQWPLRSVLIFFRPGFCGPVLQLRGRLLQSAGAGVSVRTAVQRETEEAEKNTTGT